jgi:hypothetical protein
VHTSCRTPTELVNLGELGRMLRNIPGLENLRNLKISCFIIEKSGNFE